MFLSLSTYHLLVPLHWECIEGKVSSNRRARRDTNQINAKCSGHRECVKSVTMTGWVLGIIWVFGAFDTRFQRRQHQQHCYHKHYSLLADHSELARQVHSCLKSAVFVVLLFVLLFVLFVHREGSFLQHPTATWQIDWNCLLSWGIAVGFLKWTWLLQATQTTSTSSTVTTTKTSTTRSVSWSFCVLRVYVCVPCQFCSPVHRHFHCATKEQTLTDTYFT